MSAIEDIIQNFKTNVEESFIELRQDLNIEDEEIVIDVDNLSVYINKELIFKINLEHDQPIMLSTGIYGIWKASLRCINYSTVINYKLNKIIMECYKSPQNSKINDVLILGAGETFCALYEPWMEGTIFYAAAEIKKEREYFKSIYSSKSLVRSSMDNLDLNKYINKKILNQAWENYQKVKHLDFSLERD